MVGEAEAAFARIGVAGVTATGRSRDLATSTWHEIRAGPIVGWASSNYLAPLSPETALDITAQVITDGGGDFTTDLGPCTLHSVLATPLCCSHRGVGTDGICN